ncbi:hypothetical protein ACNOYE_26110 [Nannocystaceae bacterium ST9]
MMMRSPSSFGIGEQLFSPQFLVTPADVAAWDRASVLGDRDDRPSFRPSFEGPLATGAAVPEGLILVAALGALVRSAQWGGCRLEATSLGRVRQLGRIGVGERLHAVATVRYRSRSAEASFLTLVVEVRSGSRRLAEFEVGVEVLGPTPYWQPELAA